MQRGRSHDVSSCTRKSSNQIKFDDANDLCFPPSRQHRGPPSPRVSRRRATEADGRPHQAPSQARRHQEKLHRSGRQPALGCRDQGGDVPALCRDGLCCGDGRRGQEPGRRGPLGGDGRSLGPDSQRSDCRGHQGARSAVSERLQALLKKAGREFVLISSILFSQIKSILPSPQVWQRRTSAVFPGLGSRLSATAAHAKQVSKVAAG